MRVVTEPVEDGDIIQLPCDPTIDVTCQASGMAVNTFVHGVGEAPLEQYTVELVDIDDSGSTDLSPAPDHVAIDHVDYTRMIAVTFHKDE